MMYHHERIPRDPYYEYYSSTASSTNVTSSSSTTCRPCPICQVPPTSFHSDITSGDVICTNCGAVLDEKLCDESAEWRDYSNNPNNDSDTGVGRKRARCGDSIVDETKYIGGLMPTKISSTCFTGGGGGYGGSRGGGGDDKFKLAAIRQRLKRTHNVIENRIVQEQKARYAEIVLDRQAREAKLSRGETIIEDAENNCARIVAEGGDYEGLMMRQRQESPLIASSTTTKMTATMTTDDTTENDQDERAYASLQHPKWSLSNAILLYGTLEQVQNHLLPSHSSHISSGSTDEDGGGWTQHQLDLERHDCKTRIDANTRTSLRQLYIGYELLERAARALDLYGGGKNGGGSFSNVTFRQAVATLIKFVIKNDGLRIRGIPSGGLSSMSTLSIGDGDATSSTALSLSLFGGEGMAWSAIFDAESPSTLLRSSSKSTSPSTILHRLRQYAALGSAILYLAAESTGVGRSLTEVCSAFGAFAVVIPIKNDKNAGLFDIGEGRRGGTAEEPLVRPKYCSRAMQELRAALPDVVNPLPQDGISVRNELKASSTPPPSKRPLDMATTYGHTSVTGECIPEVPSSNIIDHGYIASCPTTVVATGDAALADLTTRMANSLGLPPIAIQAATMTAIQCARDARASSATKLTKTQQHHFHCSKRRIDRPHIRPSQRSKKSTAGTLLDESPDVIAISSILLVCTAGGTMKRLARQAVNSLASSPSSSSSSVPFEVEEMSENLNDDFLVVPEESDYSRSREANSPNMSVEERNNASAHPTNSVLSSWVAWNDQPAWHRDISQLEQCTGISRKIIVSFYSNVIHPKRLFLLGVMSKLKQGRGTSTSKGTTTTTMAESAGLLHNIVAAAPLMSLRNLG